MSDDRLPTALWMDAHLRRLAAEGISYYIVNTGAYASGVILLKISDLTGNCALLVQQRDIEGILGWTAALGQEIVEEKKADEYIARAVDRDPDLWVVEIEDRERRNPFEDKIF